MTTTERAYAKLNLTLDILRKREDGYHDLRMVMQSVDLFDEITLEINSSKEIKLYTDEGLLPRDDSNIAVKAARIFFRETGVENPGLTIRLQKHLPICAGMGGGSSDGAAVLRGLRRLFCPELPGERLEEIGTMVGSDVPFCVRGGTALAEGRGEILTSLPPLSPCSLVVCKPDFPISTPELFRAVRLKGLRCHPDTAGMITALERGELDGVARRLYNVFEEFLPRRFREVEDIKGALLDQGAMGAAMTGSGPTVFGLFRREEEALAAARVLRERYRQTFFARPV